jgi:transcriptional regulator with XRE-family HTH domain
MTSSSKLGQRIKAFRLERDMTQKQVASYLGISKPTIVRLESGKGKVMDLTRAKIERQLDKAQVAAVA